MEQGANDDEVEEEDADAKHSEYKVAEVTAVRRVKNKRGFFLIYVQLGDDEACLLIEDRLQTKI